MKYTKLVAAALAIASVPAFAHAQDTASVTLSQGAKVYGPEGNEVGTIDQVSGDNVVVNTGTNSATLPASSFAQGAKGPTIGFTKAQLDAAIENAAQQAEAKVESALVAGAALRSMDGVPLGTVKSVDEAGMVVIERESGSFTLKRDMFATDANGLIVRANAADINAAIAGTTPGADAAAEASTSATAEAEAPAATSSEAAANTEAPAEASTEATAEDTAAE